MRILIATETYLPWITGVSVSTNNIARFLAQNGHQVTIVTPKQIVKGKLKKIKNIKVVSTYSLPLTFYNNAPIPFLPASLFDILRILKRARFDLVHIQEPGVTGFSTLVAAKIMQLPISGYLHFIPEQIDRVIWGRFENLLTPIINVYIRLVYNLYDAIETPSHFFANYLKRIGVKKPIEVISNGVGVNIYKPGAMNFSLRKSLGISKDDILFFYLGRLDGDKNVETLIKALPFTDKNIRLLIVGRGKKYKTLRKESERLEVSGKLIWVKYITDNEMPDYYHAADVFSIMSPYEGQSIVTLQAVSSGLPVIAADAGALPELVKDKVNGFLVKTYDFNDLSKKMNTLSRDKKLRESFGKESRKVAMPHERKKALKKLEFIFDKLDKRRFRGRQGSTS